MSTVAEAPKPYSDAKLARLALKGGAPIPAKAHRLPAEVALKDEIQKMRAGGEAPGRVFLEACRLFPALMKAAPVKPAESGEPLTPEPVNVSLPETDRAGHEVHRPHKKR